MKDNVLMKKSKAFALRIIKLSQCLKKEKNEQVISSQVFRSGTSIGANIAESQYAVSKADFINKLHVALKEASETEYWLELLCESEILTESSISLIKKDCGELARLLITSIKTAKKNE